jgi:hypothetical protein
LFLCPATVPLGDVNYTIENEGFQMLELAPGCCREKTDRDALEPEEFAREVRRLAIEAYRALTYPEIPDAELTRLKRRSEGLICQTQVPRAIDMTKWLCGVHRAIDVRLRYQEKADPAKSKTRLDEVHACCDQSTPRPLRLLRLPQSEVTMPTSSVASGVFD